MWTLYLKTIPGVLRIVEEAINLTILSLVFGSSISSPRSDVILSVSLVGFVITLIIICLHLGTTIQRGPPPIRRVEFSFDIIWGILYLIGAALVLNEVIANTNSGTWNLSDYSVQAYLAGAIVAEMAVLFYFTDAYDKYKAGKNT